MNPGAFFRRVSSFSLLMILRTYYRPHHGKGETISNYLSIHVCDNAEKCPKAPEGPMSLGNAHNFPVAISIRLVDRLARKTSSTIFSCIFPLSSRVMMPPDNTRINVKNRYLVPLCRSSSRLGIHGSLRRCDRRWPRQFATFSDLPSLRLLFKMRLSDCSPSSFFYI